MVQGWLVVYVFCNVRRGSHSPLSSSANMAHCCCCWWWLSIRSWVSAWFYPQVISWIGPKFCCQRFGLTFKSGFLPQCLPGDFGSHWPHGVHLLEMAVPVPGTPGRGHESCAALVDCCSKAGCWRRAADTLVEMQGRSMDAGAMGGKPQRNHFLRRNMWNPPI
jgi:pentatricopeptide repeat protein